jgi:hypothetical protein
MLSVCPEMQEVTAVHPLHHLYDSLNIVEAAAYHRMLLPLP